MRHWTRAAELARGMRAMRRARERERWPRERMREHHSAAVDELVRDVVARSPFYRERLGGLPAEGRVELDALPSLDKATLMANLDDALCDPRLRGLNLRAHLEDESLLLGEYRVLASSGSTGTPSVYVYSRAEWTGVLASSLRYTEIGGVRPRLPRLRVATIGAPTLASMTQRAVQSFDLGVYRMLRLSATDPLPRMVDRLNAFRPQALNAYPSIAALLADEQLAGRLRIAPRAVSTSSELCTPETSERIQRAFGVTPFNLYASSEGLFGVDCDHHVGIHLFEDWCMVENIDGDGRPVPDGEPGERLLVTNLLNRTLPMIRFEVSDVLVIDREPCACGRTLPRARALRGCSSDVLRVPGRNGRAVALHPLQFAVVSHDPDVREFQVVHEGSRLRVLVVPREGASAELEARLTATLGARLVELGVREPQIAVERRAELARSAAGKLQLITSSETTRDAPGAAPPDARHGDPDAPHPRLRP